MTYQGVLKKMMTENSDQIQYYLDMNDDFINMNQLLNTTITIDFVTYECLHCHLEKEIYRSVIKIRFFFWNCLLFILPIIPPQTLSNLTIWVLYVVRLISLFS